MAWGRPTLVRLVGAVVGLGLLHGCSGSSERAGSATTSTVAGPVSTTAPAVTAPSTTSSTAGTVTTAAVVERCTGSSAQLSALDQRAATGHSLRIYELRNSSARACRVDGYPAVTLRDAAGRTLAQAQTKAGFILPGRPPAAVNLRAGQSAYLGIESTTVCAGDAGVTTSSTLHVTLPNDTVPMVVPAQVVVCAPPDIIVSPVRATQEDVTRP